MPSRLVEFAAEGVAHNGPTTLRSAHYVNTDAVNSGVVAIFDGLDASGERILTLGAQAGGADRFIASDQDGVRIDTGIFIDYIGVAAGRVAVEHEP